ncbi:hypothetical protein K504DRAFT_204330 [Pleomassaria siparia CBS 279.74]|uniref:Uncharacterized protein n=1 Tax=Pleomassaria siparia CBS 279.74 TaxID=1314801 RepID=A0A6G1KHY0_9PLEO|nr:hypothetical protein K504DRAFT_204330 [Pleomassaria siparia CBS 279.74]
MVATLPDNRVWHPVASRRRCGPCQPVVSIRTREMVNVDHGRAASGSSATSTCDALRDHLRSTPTMTVVCAALHSALCTLHSAHCTAEYSTVQYSTIQHSTAQRSTSHHSTAHARFQIPITGGLPLAMPKADDDVLEWASNPQPHEGHDDTNHWNSPKPRLFRLLRTQGSTFSNMRTNCRDAICRWKRKHAVCETLVPHCGQWGLRMDSTFGL